MRYELLPEARLDMRRLHAFLDERNPQAAHMAMLTIDKGLLRPVDHPFPGRPIPNAPHLHQLVIRFGKGGYIVHYRIENDIPVITRIRHSREDRP